MNKNGAGTSVPSNTKGVEISTISKQSINGTKVPAPGGQLKGAGVLTPSEQSHNGTEVPTPSGNFNGTEVLAPREENNTTPRRFLPHIDMVGYYQFVTFRTHDSLDDFIKKIRSEEISSRKQEYKIDQYIDQSPNGAYLDNEVLKYLYRYFVIQDKNLYDLVAFTIMPNHVHIFFKQNVELPQIMKRIKGATAFAINKMLDRKGIFWEENYYDKLIRDEVHFSQVYDYIKYNAVKVDLRDAEERFYGIYE